MARLQISNDQDADAEPIDAYLEEYRPRKRSPPTLEALKQELEDEFLKPSTTFGANWLNKLQQYVYFSEAG